MGKHLESECRAYAYRQYEQALMQAEQAAGQILAAGGLGIAPKTMVANFVAAQTRADEYLRMIHTR